MNEVYGIKDQKVLEENIGLTFVKELCITPKRVICQLKGVENAFLDFCTLEKLQEDCINYMNIKPSNRLE